MMQLSWDDKPELYDDENEVSKLKIYRDQDENQIVPIYLSPAEFEKILHSFFIEKIKIIRFCFCENFNSRFSIIKYSFYHQSYIIEINFNFSISFFLRTFKYCSIAQIIFIILLNIFITSLLKLS